MASYYLMMDVGGTGIKAGLLDEGGSMISEIVSFDARSREEKQVIFANFAFILRTMAAGIDPVHNHICGIGMAFPGPFDYKRGISLMRGLDKYDSVYGCDIKEEIVKQLHAAAEGAGKWDCQFHYLHDAEAFALGESRFGPARDKSRLFCVCLGTGAGSAFLEDGKVLKQRGDIPDQGWIYKTPFKDGIIDDYLSVRGLKKLAKEWLLEPADGAGLWRLASDGNRQALSVFEVFGSHLKGALVPFLERFRPDGLVLGGQISKSFSFFGSELEDYCKQEGISVHLTPDTSRRAMEGLFVTFQQEENEGDRSGGKE